MRDTRRLSLLVACLVLTVACGCAGPNSVAPEGGAEDPVVRARRALDIEQGGSGNGAELLKILEDRDIAVRRTAYESLARMMRREGIEPVPQFYAAAPEDVRREQVAALRRLWHNRRTGIDGP